jgi:hypothetical protein
VQAPLTLEGQNAGKKMSLAAARIESNDIKILILTTAFFNKKKCCDLLSANVVKKLD